MQDRTWAAGGVGRSVLMFGAAGILALFITGVGVTLAFRNSGKAEAIKDAQVMADLVAGGIVEPELTDALLEGNPDALARFDAVVRSRVLGARIVRVKLWRADGEIVYSDETRLIGARFALDDEEVAALTSGKSDASVSDLSAPENIYEEPNRPLLEVYQAVHTPSGQPALMESYLPYVSVAASAESTWRSFLPALVVGLVALGVLQFPMAWSLARRISNSRGERLRLMERAADAAELERRHIAAELHDTVVQDLAGQRFALLAAASSSVAGEDPVSVLHSAAETLGTSVRRLREVLSELRPPTLRAGKLQEALDDLRAQFEGSGLKVGSSIGALPELAPHHEAAIFKVAREALRNSQKHSGSASVFMALSMVGRKLILTISDNGCGFDAASAASRPDVGHLGLELLQAAAREADGALRIASAPSVGTTITLEVPL